MKHIVIYYFSGTGNTWWLAEELKKQLLIKNNRAASYSIEGLSPETVTKQVSEADHIILGFPVYGSTAPKIMLDFIDRLPQASNAQTATVFGTQALASGDTAYFVGKRLIKKGYDLRQTMHFRMMNNLHLPAFRFYPPKNDESVIRLHRKNLPKVEGLADKITNGKRHLTGKYTLGIFLGRLQRSHMDALTEKFGRSLEINEAACINCNKCQRICPTGNITQADGGYTFGNNCNICLRCYSQCPQNAILIGGASADIKKYPRYRGPQEGFNVFTLINKDN